MNMACINLFRRRMVERDWWKYFEGWMIRISFNDHMNLSAIISRLNSCHCLKKAAMATAITVWLSHVKMAATVKERETCTSLPLNFFRFWWIQCQMCGSVRLTRSWYQSFYGGAIFCWGIQIRTCFWHYWTNQENRFQNQFHFSRLKSYFFSLKSSEAIN